MCGSLNEPAATSIDAADTLELGSDISSTRRELLRVRTLYVRSSSVGLYSLIPLGGGVGEGDGDGEGDGEGEGVDTCEDVEVDSEGLGA